MFKFNVLISFALVLLFNLGIAWGVQDEIFVQDERTAVLRASDAWANSLNNKEPEKTAALYANYISVYATFATKIDNYNDLLEYFKKLCDKDNFKVAITEQNVRIYGPIAINSGEYDFSYKVKGKRLDIPARFTFVYSLTPSGWKIVEHHSSILPE